MSQHPTAAKPRSRLSSIPKPKYWVGEPDTTCNMCSDNIVDEFSDANLGGRWGIFCNRCFKRYELSYGLGRGQRYTKQADGKWLKTAG